jgi:hypothetical protein
VDTGCTPNTVNGTCAATAGVAGVVWCNSARSWTCSFCQPGTLKGGSDNPTICFMAGSGACGGSGLGIQHCSADGTAWLACSCG